MDMLEDREPAKYLFLLVQTSYFRSKNGASPWCARYSHSRRFFAILTLKFGDDAVSANLFEWKLIQNLATAMWFLIKSDSISGDFECLYTKAGVTINKYCVQSSLQNTSPDPTARKESTCKIAMFGFSISFDSHENCLLFPYCMLHRTGFMPKPF